MREWRWILLLSVHFPMHPRAVCTGLPSCVANQHTGLTWDFSNQLVIKF